VDEEDEVVEGNKTPGTTVIKNSNSSDKRKEWTMYPLFLFLIKI